MRRIVHFIPALVLLLILCTQSAFAQVRYTIKTQKVEIVGTSNIHDWTASVGKLSGISDFYVENNTITGIKSAVVDVDANSLAGSKGSSFNVLAVVYKNALTNYTTPLTGKSTLPQMQKL